MAAGALKPWSSLWPGGMSAWAKRAWLPLWPYVGVQAWPVCQASMATYPAAPGLSQALPSLSLSSRGCPLGPRSLSFLGRSSCPLLSSQTALHQRESRRLSQTASARTKTTACHPRSPPHPGHLALPLYPRLTALGAWDNRGSRESRDKWCGRVCGNCPLLLWQGFEDTGPRRVEDHLAGSGLQPDPHSLQIPGVLVGGRLAGGEWTGQGLECQAKELDVKADRALSEESGSLGCSPHTGQSP